MNNSRGIKKSYRKSILRTQKLKLIEYFNSQRYPLFCSFIGERWTDIDKDRKRGLGSFFVFQKGSQLACNTIFFNEIFS
jgi:hypothetical protein